MTKDFRLTLLLKMVKNISVYQLSGRTPVLCTHCGTEMRIIAFLTETATVTRFLQHIGEPTKAPVLSPARRAARRGNL
jgi:hypothetical protein